MRKIVFAASLVLAAFPARAQTESSAAANCGSHNFDVAIAGCTQLIQTAHQTKQMLAFAYNNRAWAYHRKGDDQAGLRDVDMALLLAPKNAAVIETRAEIYEKLGKHDQAVADYRAALKLDPKMKQASDGLKRLNATP
ncbi:MAG: tetratricopeptide repeat protein [Stellaceae bacterium]